MAKLSINSLLEVSKMLSTKAGQELQEALQYLNSLADNTLRALRQGLTVRDNIKGLVSVVSLKTNIEQVVNYDVTQRIFAVLPVRTISTIYGIDNFIWFMNPAGQLVVKLGLTGAPTESVEVTLVILYE